MKILISRTNLWVAIVAFVLAWIPVALTCAQEAGSDSESVAEAAAVDTERVESLISQLADASFAVRQQATRELWAMGEGILSELEFAAQNGARGETRVRLNELILFAKCGIDPGVSEEVVQCVSGFLEREYNVQLNSLLQLQRLDQGRTVERLINLLDKDRQQDLSDHFSTLSTAREALLDGDFDKFDQWLERAEESGAHKTFCYYARWARGELDAEIEKLEGQVKSEIEAGENYLAALPKLKQQGSDDTPAAPDQSKLRDLVGLLRFQGRVEEALRYSESFVDSENRRSLVHAILMESGRWGKLQELMVSSAELEAAFKEGGKDGRDKIKGGLAFEAEGYKRALVQFYAMDQEACGKTCTEIEKGLKKGDTVHARFLGYVLERERSKKFRNMELNNVTFSWLSDGHRYEELFEMFELQTVEKRMKFFRDRLAECHATKTSFNFLKKMTSTEKRRLMSKLRRSRDYYLEAVILLDCLGFSEEAEFHLRNLYFSGLDKQLRAELHIADALRELCAFDSAWEIARIHFDRTGDDVFFRSLLGGDTVLVAALNKQLESQVPDVTERFQLVAKLIKFPSVSQPSGEVNIWEEFDRWGIKILDSVQTNLFHIWHLEDEIDIPQPVIGSMPIWLSKLIDKGDFIEAAQVLETMGGSVPAVWAQAAWAYEKAGRQDRAVIMQLLFMSNYKVDSTYSTLTGGFAERPFRRYAFDALRLHECLNFDTNTRNSHALLLLSSGSKTDDETDPFEEMVRTQIVRLNSRARNVSVLSDAICFVRGHLAKEDVAGAKYWFRKQLKYESVDSTLCESTFPMMIKTGNTELVDELFKESAEGFYSILSRYPESSLYLNNYAWVCAKARKNLDNAIELSQRSIKHRPIKSGYYDTLAELYFAKGDCDKAIETIERSIELYPMRDYYHEQLKKFRLKSKASK